MSSVTPETLARAFHDTYERLAPTFGYQTRPETAVSWERLSAANKRLMIAVCAELLETVLAEQAAPRTSEQDDTSAR